jgi:hypothetical protein
MIEKPTTAAGRQMLEDYHYPLTTEEVIEHINAIEVESRTAALQEALELWRHLSDGRFEIRMNKLIR